MHFLFGILDKDRRSAEFRDCYPILDKKAESQFRQKAFSWYTGKIYILLFSLSRVENTKRTMFFFAANTTSFSILGLVSKSNDLPSITASLFLSPGGRKFLDFMNAFVRYVAKHCLIKVGQIELKFSVLPVSNQNIRFLANFLNIGFVLFHDRNTNIAQEEVGKTWLEVETMLKRIQTTAVTRT